MPITGQGRWHAGPGCHRHRGRGRRLAADFPTTARPPGKPRAPAGSTNQGDSNEVPWASRVSPRWLTTGNGGRRRSVVEHQRAHGTAALGELLHDQGVTMELLKPKTWWPSGRWGVATCGALWRRWWTPKVAAFPGDEGTIGDNITSGHNSRSRTHNTLARREKWGVNTERGLAGHGGQGGTCS
jgi:hypothetical protein